MRAFASTIDSLLQEMPVWKSRGVDQHYYDRGNKEHHFGAYFEHLMAAVLGGTVQYPILTSADIYDEESQTHREVKATRKGKHTVIVENQFTEQTGISQDEPVQQIIVRHDVDRLRSKDKELLHGAAAASPKFALVMPHGVLHRAIQHRAPFSKFTTWGPLPVYTISATFFDALALHTDSCLRAIGLEPDSYAWQMYKTEHLHILDCDVRPFLMTYITEKQ